VRDSVEFNLPRGRLESGELSAFHRMAMTGDGDGIVGRCSWMRPRMRPTAGQGQMDDGQPGGDLSGRINRRSCPWRWSSGPVDAWVGRLQAAGARDEDVIRRRGPLARRVQQPCTR